MLRLIGALLLMGGVASVGFSATAHLERRVKSLRAMLGALERLEHELAFRLTPMPELLAELAEQTAAPVSDFFARCLAGMGTLGEKTLAELWDEALALVYMDFAPEEVQVLHTLGGVLGRYDGEGQREALALAQARLGQCLASAAAERTGLGRVYGTLGLTTGTLLAILLL